MVLVYKHDVYMYSTSLRNAFPEPHNMRPPTVSSRGMFSRSRLTYLTKDEISETRVPAAQQAALVNVEPFVAPGDLPRDI